MKALIFLLFIMSPMREVDNLKLTFPSPQQEIFMNYENDNFSQHLVYHNDMITADIKSLNFFKLVLNFTIVPDRQYIASLHPGIQKIISSLVDDSRSFQIYLANVSYFLRDNIRYADNGGPQDAAAVFLFKRANCVGFANAMKVLLDAVGIENDLVKGFYLKKGKRNILIPVPHRWVEIHLGSRLKFFYDPQYQDFSARYIATKNDVDFKRIKKFRVYVLNKSKKIVN